MGSQFITSDMATSNLPPELIERINKPEKPRFKSPFETSSGGFVPYTSMTRRSRSLGATTLVQSPSISHVSETLHWLTRNQVGDPTTTAWMINEKGKQSGSLMNTLQVFSPSKKPDFTNPNYTR